MRARDWWLGMAVAVCVIVTACRTVAEDERQQVEIREIAKGGFSGYVEPERLVVTNLTQWREVWNTHAALGAPAPPVPKVDFDQEFVLFVALGRKNTGGHGIEVTGVERIGKEYVARTRTRSPAPGGFNIQALTAPFHIVAVKGKAGRVKFEEGSGARSEVDVKEGG